MISFDYSLRQVPKFLVAIAIFCGASVPSQAQIDPERLKLLHQKYDWGSIYLSYAIMPDIIQVLDNQIRLQRIRAAYNSSPPQSMVTFLSRYRSPSGRKSIMLFQINFSAKTPIAGFLTSNDWNGTIQKAPMSSDEVLAAANWIDLYLVHGNEFAKTLLILKNPNTTLVEAWNAIKKLNDNAFVSENRISSLLAEFKQLHDNREKELELLKTTDGRLHRTLQLFSTQYDATIASFFQEFITNAQANPWKMAPDNSPDDDFQKHKKTQDEVMRFWGHTFQGSSPILSFEMQQDLVKLKLYQDYQQLLKLEDKEQKPTQPRE